MIIIITCAVLKQFGSKQSCKDNLSPGRGTVGLFSITEKA